MTKAIYVPKGKAGEYADFALNLYKGCSHGCTYCYAPNVVHRGRKDFHGKVTIREGILDKLRKEARDYRGKKVFLCFTCDPYTTIDGVPGPITREAIKILGEAGCGVEVLSKAGEICKRDFSLLTKTLVPSAFGTTLTTIDHEKAREVEPNAATPLSRCISLKAAHERGINTFASLEPVMWPEDTLEVIRVIHSFTDRIKVGRWNYDKGADKIDWRKFAQDARNLCESLEVDYFIKRDLAVFLED